MGAVGSLVSLGGIPRIGSGEWISCDSIIAGVLCLFPGDLQPPVSVLVSPSKLLCVLFSWTHTHGTPPGGLSLSAIVEKRGKGGHVEL